jgi:hypothetical protein
LAYAHSFGADVARSLAIIATGRWHLQDISIMIVIE